MRRWILSCTGVILALAVPLFASAQQAVDVTDRSLQLEQQLSAARVEIARLNAAAAAESESRLANSLCAAKNKRLVEIAGDLIADYDRRYSRSHQDLFQFARRRFEMEMQDRATAVYQNRLDATAAPSLAATAP